MFTLAPGVTLSQVEDGLTWMITVAMVESAVLTVMFWAGLTPPLGMLLNVSGVLGLVSGGLTVSTGCADAVSEQPKTAKAARAANIKGLGQFMTYLASSTRRWSAIRLPFDYKTNRDENVLLADLARTSVNPAGRPAAAERLLWNMLPDFQDCAIRAVNLTRFYRSGGADLVVFSGLNFEVARGERLALVGESGAGKSTLLHLLGGLDRPTEGEIYFGQKDICKLSEAGLAEFRNREVGFVWQIHSLLAEFSALENVMMPLLIRGQAREAAEPVALARLGEVGLQNRASHRAGELSGGEQQRVVLARALAGDPGVLLADEPTGSLDFRTGEMIMDLLEDLHRSRRLTSIHVTHNLNFAKRADRVLALERGQLVLAPLSSDSQEGRAYV
jgi:lipoprotein-releasing system ATP-binding protein